MSRFSRKTHPQVSPSQTLAHTGNRALFPHQLIPFGTPTPSTVLPTYRQSTVNLKAPFWAQPVTKPYIWECVCVRERDKGTGTAEPGMDAEWWREVPAEGAGERVQGAHTEPERPAGGEGEREGPAGRWLYRNTRHPHRQKRKRKGRWKTQEPEGQGRVEEGWGWVILGVLLPLICLNLTDTHCPVLNPESYRSLSPL